MQCEKCGNKIEYGQLYCPTCGFEIQIVPDYEVEIDYHLNGLELKINDELNNKDVELNEDENTELSNDIQSLKQSKVTKKSKIIFIILIAIFVIFTIIVSIKVYQNNSFDYQMKKANEYYINKKYKISNEYLSNALKLEKNNATAKMMLANNYYLTGDTMSAIILLKELTVNYSEEEQYFDFLISIYSENEKYEEIHKLLSDTTNENIIKKYQEYIAYNPTFNIEGGLYNEMINLEMYSSDYGNIYYSTDGSIPTKDSNKYYAPILLEKGTHTFNAIYINKFGVASEPVKIDFIIDLPKVASPVINIDSGNYYLPQVISVKFAKDTDIYYTIDGSTPTKDSIKYTKPINMQFGMSEYKFIAYNEDGVASDIATRNFNFIFESAVKLSDALNISNDCINNHAHTNIISNKYPRIQGSFVSDCKSVVYVDGIIYYYIEEYFNDSQENYSKTDNVYLIDSQSGEMYYAQLNLDNTYNKIIIHN